MRIGIISDTHSYLDPSVFKYFSQCDEIWHAGDIGTLDVLQQLEAFKPTMAVFGNVDGHDVRAASPEDQVFVREGKKILMTHIAGSLPRYNPRVRDLIKTHQPDVLVCGHSHLLKVQPDKANNLLFINPGAAGRHGFHKIKTLLRLEIQEGKIQNLEVVELGPRGQIS
ncbi:metallophosphoesterase [Marinoscillum sp. 108]|uniref:metallophosphoesterase family protein n=1 Tax=Marinoscillum sp. 108 TaxID=2653151 RepID=UPI0012F0E91A|nr:metallophosphoesterase family protein [Marinoscillum sp. 108]VXD13454.1 Phosphoesterase [Marinoscillum sp. 108]